MMVATATSPSTSTEGCGRVTRAAAPAAWCSWSNGSAEAPAEEATERPFKLIGMAAQYASKQIVCTYDYVDPRAAAVSEGAPRPEGLSAGGRLSAGVATCTVADPKRPLYGLPGVITCDVSFITEGEKDADSLNAVDGLVFRYFGTGLRHNAGRRRLVDGTSRSVHRGQASDDLRGQRREGTQRLGTRIAESGYPIRLLGTLRALHEIPMSMAMSLTFFRSLATPRYWKRSRPPSFRPRRSPRSERQPSSRASLGDDGNPETDWLVDGIIQAEGTGSSWAILRLRQVSR